MSEMTKQRPGTMRLVDATKYRLPLAALVSILHRASGLLIFVLLPFLLWLFDNSLSSEATYSRFTSAFIAGIGVVPAWCVKLVVWVLIWAFLHHLMAGLRHLWLDATHRVSKDQGRHTAVVTLALSLLLTLVFGAKLFGLF